MDNQYESQPQLPNPPARPRRFIHRATQTDSSRPHPMRRATDMPQAIENVSGELSPSALLLKFRDYLKLN